MDWKYKDGKLKTSLKGVRQLKIDVSNYYPMEFKDNWPDHSQHVVSPRVLGACSNCTKDILCSDHKKVWDEMPVVYITEANTNMSGLKNPFRDPRIKSYVILTNELIASPTAIVLDYQKHEKAPDFDVYLKPGILYGTECKASTDINIKHLDGDICTVHHKMEQEGLGPRVNLYYYAEEHISAGGSHVRLCGGVRIKQILQDDLEKQILQDFYYTDGVLLEPPRMFSRFNDLYKIDLYHGTVAGPAMIPESFSINNIYKVAQPFSSTAQGHVGYSNVTVAKKILGRQMDGYSEWNKYTYTTARDDEDIDDSLVKMNFGFPYYQDTYYGLQQNLGISEFTSRSHSRGLPIEHRKDVYAEGNPYTEVTTYKYSIAEQKVNEYIPNAYHIISTANYMPLVVPFSTLRSASVGINELDPLAKDDDGSSGLLIEPVGLIGDHGIFTFGRHRLIPYNTYLKSKKIVTSKGGNSETKEYTYKYPSENYNSDDKATLPVYLIEKDVDTEETNSTHMSYTGDKIKEELKFRNGKLVSRKEFNYSLNLLQSVMEYSIDPETSTIQDYRTSKRYSYSSCWLVREEGVDGLVSSYIREGDNRVRFIYKGGEDLLSNPDAHKTEIKYDNIFPDKISQVIEPNGVSTYYEYDGFGRLIS